MADFSPAIEFVLDHEDPSRSGKVSVDAGGRTRFGIAQKFHPSLSDRFFTGPVDEALEQAEDILRKEYWDLLLLVRITNQNVANKLFDMAVNMGAHQAVIYAQRAANGLLQSGVDLLPGAASKIAEDGAIGDKTLAAINALDPLQFYELLGEFSKQHYIHIANINPGQAIYLQGWLKRAGA